ncbi:MAG TPA: hypothetical protein DCR78_22860 [Pseudomonas sp.]|jgi:hypothetical protein|uniref:hypothetical protein n=1 Tax=Stutzerimonas xanthomarina TaxID=271420 RepID=UPI000E9C097D|nr:hypothetical protein [Stutzerimonas xanthomarina]MBU0812553.1 hypothetical protein [Gammaproteobacteria bacterium]HAQ89259.1 hypothetical protein [Pseudomonas sp.]MBK3849494.1 hypothetical protein [Stutzerimonas xanthomarina]MBU0854014.1 hypothetical protein [Gammaproteobacteria bacterium]MBU1302242.1 hypothetical protein [Gammaproteobacteria bacterium]|tara:strand:+ start:11459 stop:12061 length:603 start_codon:yes stop_codon:yes gene_type:complete
MPSIQLLSETELDQLNYQMYGASMEIAKAYLASISAVIRSPITERELYTHLLISVRVHSPGSWSASWCKKVPVMDTPQSKRTVEGLRKNARIPSGRYVTRELPKGNGDRYPNSTFKALPIEVRDIAIYYEGLLAKLRRAAKDNRAMKKAEFYCLERGAKALAECTTSIERCRQVLADVEAQGLRDLKPLTNLVSRSQELA